MREDAANLRGRLGSEDAAATEARTARPNAQGPGNTVHGHPVADRQIAEELTAGDAMEMDERQANEDDAMDMGSLGSLEPTAEDFMSDVPLQQLGSSGRTYRR